VSADEITEWPGQPIEYDKSVPTPLQHRGNHGFLASKLRRVEL
jgi:hypothetical protein